MQGQRFEQVQLLRRSILNSSWYSGKPLQELSVKGISKEPINTKSARTSVNKLNPIHIRTDRSTRIALILRLFCLFSATMMQATWLIHTCCVICKTAQEQTISFTESMCT